LFSGDRNNNTATNPQLRVGQIPLREKYHHKSNYTLTRDVSTILKFASRSVGTKPRSNVLMYIILASVHFARSSNRFMSSSSESTFACLPAENNCDLVSSQESQVTVSSRNVTAVIILIVSVV